MRSPYWKGGKPLGFSLRDKEHFERSVDHDEFDIYLAKIGDVAFLIMKNFLTLRAFGCGSFTQ